MPTFCDRNKLWQSPSLQARVQNARVVIGGMGGLGWQIGAGLVSLGVQHIDVFDPDNLEIVNFNRLWGCSQEDIGAAKVSIFKRKAEHINPDVKISIHKDKIPCKSVENAIESADVIFGGFDSSEARLATQILALKKQTLFIDAGVGMAANTDKLSGFGQVFICGRHNHACVLCAGLKLNNTGYLMTGIGAEPSTGVLNGLIGNMVVSIWLQILEGEDPSQYTRLNWNPLEITAFGKIEKVAGCPVCGENAGWQTEIDF